MFEGGEVMGQFQERIKMLRPKSEDLKSSDDEVRGDAQGRELTVESMLEIVEEAKKEYEGLTVIGIAMESTHTRKPGRPKTYIDVQVTGFTPEERITNLEVELKAKDKWFLKWFMPSPTKEK